MKIEKLSPAFKDYLWGGTKLRDVYGKKCDYEKVAESWELSTHPAGQSVIDGGEYDGLKFGEYLEKVGAKALGVNGAKFKEFPVLIKFIDAKQPLSVQVHPSDEYALRVEGEYGKTEMWYVVDCEPGASLYFGVNRALTKEEFKKRIEDNTLTDVLYKADVKKGDVFFIQSGTIHAIGAGCLMLEAQEPTDFTIQPEYWCGEYHLNAQEMYLGLPAETALECFDFTRYGQRVVEQSRKIPRVLREAPGLRVECLIGPEDTSCFSMTRYCLTDGTAALDVPASIWICIEGSGEVTGENYRRALHRGDYFFLPAAAEGYALHGENLQIVCCMGGK